MLKQTVLFIYFLWSSMYWTFSFMIFFWCGFIDIVVSNTTNIIIPVFPLTVLTLFDGTVSELWWRHESIWFVTVVDIRFYFYKRWDCFVCHKSILDVMLNHKMQCMNKCSGIAFLYMYKELWMIRYDWNLIWCLNHVNIDFYIYHPSGF